MLYIEACNGNRMKVINKIPNLFLDYSEEQQQNCFHFVSFGPNLMPAFTQKKKNSGPLG
jgi:hypothetical protein